MSEHACYEIEFPGRSPFGKVLSLGWYDGTTSGLVQCSRCLAVYKYDIVDWDSDQENRIFALSPIALQAFEEIVELLSNDEEPRWPFWCPTLQVPLVEKQRIKNELDLRLASAKRPEYLLASDRELRVLYAGNRLDSSALDHLPTEFDGLPVSNSFDYWKRYVRLCR